MTDTALISQDSDFKVLLQKKKLTNVQTATVLKVVVARMLAVNKNQINVGKQLRIVGERIDRLEALMLDRIGPDGKPVLGVGTSLHETQKVVEVLQHQGSAIMLRVQTLSRLIPWLIEKAAEGPLDEDEVVKAAAEIQKSLQAIGDKAQEDWDKVEVVGAAMARCGGCALWKEGSGLEVEGKIQTGACTQKFVQVKCPGCQRVHGPPVDPNDVTGECVKCKTKLTREIDLPDGGKRTMCGQYRRDPEKLRAAMLEQEIPVEIVNEVVPPPAPADPGE